MKFLDRNIWHSSITLTTKVCHYIVYVLLVLLNGSETCTMTTVLHMKVDILTFGARSWYFIASSGIMSPPRLFMVRQTDRHVCLFGHIAILNAELEDCCALRTRTACWRKPRGCLKTHMDPHSRIQSASSLVVLHITWH